MWCRWCRWCRSVWITSQIQKRRPGHRVEPLGAGRALSVGRQLWGAALTTNASWNGTTGTLGSTSLSGGRSPIWELWSIGFRTKSALAIEIYWVYIGYPSFSTIMQLPCIWLLYFINYSFSPKSLTLSNSIRLLVSWCRHCAHFGSRGAWRSGAFTKRSLPTSRWLLSVLSGSMSGFIGISRGDMGTGNGWLRKRAVAPLAQAFSLAAGHLRLGNPSCQCRPRMSKLKAYHRIAKWITEDHCICYSIGHIHEFCKLGSTVVFRNVDLQCPTYSTIFHTTFVWMICRPVFQVSRWFLRSRTSNMS